VAVPVPFAFAECRARAALTRQHRRDTEPAGPEHRIWRPRPSGRVATDRFRVRFPCRRRHSVRPQPRVLGPRSGPCRSGLRVGPSWGRWRLRMPSNTSGCSRVAVLSPMASEASRRVMSFLLCGLGRARSGGERQAVTAWCGRGEPRMVDAERGSACIEERLRLPPRARGRRCRRQRSELAAMRIYARPVPTTSLPTGGSTWLSANSAPCSSPAR
jgi:hypothetical protein